MKRMKKNITGNQSHFCYMTGDARLSVCMCCSEGEPQVLDYQTQQYKLFPLLASTYAYWLSGLKMRATYFLLNYEIQQGNTDLLPEVNVLVMWSRAVSDVHFIFASAQ